MNVIAENDYYKLAYDESKNRVLWRMIGFWKSLAVVPDFDKDWDRAQSLAKPGFTIYADLSKLEIMPPEVEKAQEERQKKLIHEGCRRVACLIGKETSKISLNKALKGSGMEKILRYCDSNKEAAEWLA